MLTTFVVAQNAPITPTSSPFKKAIEAEEPPPPPPSPSQSKPITPEEKLQLELERDSDLQGVEFHQIYIEEHEEGKKVKSIDNVRYKDGSGKLKGELSEDRNRILLQNYTKRGRVLIDVTYEDGTTEELSKGSCFIDPVPPM